MMHFARPAVFVLALAAAISGCATTFTGSPMFPGGPRGCWEYCKGAKLEFSAWVMVGEYSSACACRPPGAVASATDMQGAVVAAAAGVETQRQQAQQQQMQMQSHH